MGVKRDPAAVRVLVVIELVPIAGAERDPAAVRVLVVIELVPIAGAPRDPAVKVLAKTPAGKNVGTEDERM